MDTLADYTIVVASDTKTGGTWTGATPPKGSYFTVSQAAQVCGVTSKQIRAWIRRSKLDAIELPGLGIIIETGKLNAFLCRRNS